MMRPKPSEILKRMITTETESATALAAAAGVTRSTATKVMRGESVTLSVAVKINSAIGGSRPIGHLFSSSFDSMPEEFEGDE